MDENKVIELAEYIVIIYANLSGRDSENRAVFRHKVIETITDFFAGDMNTCEICGKDVKEHFGNNRLCSNFRTGTASFRPEKESL